MYWTGDASTVFQRTFCEAGGEGRMFECFECSFCVRVPESPRKRGNKIQAKGGREHGER